MLRIFLFLLVLFFSFLFQTEILPTVAYTLNLNKEQNIERGGGGSNKAVPQHHLLVFLNAPTFPEKTSLQHYRRPSALNGEREEEQKRRKERLWRRRVILPLIIPVPEALYTDFHFYFILNNVFGRI